MEQHLTANMLKYAAGQTMFCPGCETCMDWRRTVSIDFTGATSGKLHATQTLCATCADKLLPGLADRLAKAEAKAGEKLLVTTTDGRDWNEDEDYEPAPTPRMGGLVEFQAARRDNPAGEKVSGFIVESGLPDWGRFAAYSKDADLWWCVELTTGYAFAQGESFKSAVIAGFRKMRQVGRDKFAQAVKRAPALNAF